MAQLAVHQGCSPKRSPTFLQLEVSDDDNTYREHLVVVGIYIKYKYSENLFRNCNIFQINFCTFIKIPLSDDGPPRLLKGYMLLRNVLCLRLN